MSERVFRMDSNQQEILNDVLWEFPYLNTGSELSASKRAPWHWHPAVEIVYIDSGTALYKLPQADVTVPQDGILFINHEIFHAAEPAAPHEIVQYRCQLVEPEFFANGAGGLIKRKYIDPVIQCADLPYVLIRPGDPIHAEALFLLRDSIAAADKKPELHEYRIHQNLTRFWMLLIQSTQDIWQNSTPKNDIRSLRIRQMIAFIQGHSAEKLTLEQIADSAGISPRECLRTFQSTLKTTPFEYLIDCRVRRAADRLQNSSDSILDIALACGFSSSSYFCRIFKKTTGLSPTEFKRTHRPTPEA